MKKLLVILLIFMCAQPVHAEEPVFDRDLLLMEYMATISTWIHYVCNKPVINMDDPIQRKHVEQFAKNMANWLESNYGKNWRIYMKYYAEIGTNNTTNMINQNAIDIYSDRYNSLEGTLFCKRLFELDTKTYEMFMK
ncbi:MAG: hypothetical protein LBV80_10930 [Deltaproteobacteria bacterium]|jgi:hypothetical protein|nr:hypothetical protein [Deltaproteobacteria bacterium]